LAGVVDMPAMSQSLDRKLDPLDPVVNREWPTTPFRAPFTSFLYLKGKEKEREGRRKEGKGRRRRGRRGSAPLQNRRSIARSIVKRDVPRGKGGKRARGEGGRGEGSGGEFGGESWRTGTRERRRDAS